MDKLSLYACEARRVGLSYGKYIALYHPPKPPAERYPKKKTKDETEPRCTQCGMLIPPEVRSKKYCCQECADEARRQRDREHREKTKQAKPPEEKPRPICILCGKPIPAYAARRKYCSAACSDQALEEQRRKANQRRREAARLKIAEMK